MRAVRVAGPGEIQVTEVPEPSSKGDALVRIHQVGICGTDVKIVAGKIAVDYPRIAGHEMIGEIVDPGPGGPFAAGTRVLIDPGVSCGWCHLCHEGRTNICVNGGLMGRDVDGVFTELAVAPVERLIPVPASITDKAAGLLQVLGTTIHAVKCLDPFPGRVAAVIGLGVTGQLIAQLLRLRGMSVLGITRSEWKRQLATDLGATWVADPDEARIILDAVTGGRGADLVVEAVGTEATLARAIELTATGGEVLVYGTITGGDRGLPYYQLYHKELALHNPRAAVARDYEDGVALAAAGDLSLEPIVTHELDLSEAVRAFELVEDPASMKVLMRV